MDSFHNTESSGDTTDDLSALSWVHEELRRSLDVAHKALRRFVKETEALAGSDVDVVDPAVLRTARQQIHQGVGALELIGLSGAAAVLRACEAAVQRYVAKPHKLTSQVVDDIERASFALLDYLSRMLAGKTVSALSMFPQYRAVQEAAGADRAHPADLWTMDWRWRDLPDAEPQMSPRQPDEATRLALEQQMLVMMRRPTVATASHMSDIFAALGAGAQHPHIASLWKLAAAVFEAQAQGLLKFDVFGKRVAARLLAQLRIIERGETDVSERLALDLLFFCAQAASPGAGRAAPRLSIVRQAYGLARYAPVDYTVAALGRFDPAWIAQARKRLSAAKESWSAVAGGEMHRLSGLVEQFSLIGESLKRLFPSGDLLAHELQQAVSLIQQGGAAPSAPLAMEVATSLLYLDAALEDADFDNPEQDPRVRRLVERIAAARQGATPPPLEGWMEDLYRRVSDRQTMGSVVQELRASLSEVEKLIDQFFRNPADRNVLIPVPHQLSAMRGVLSVLGMDHAAAALLRMRDEIDGLASTEVDPARVTQAGVFDRLAGNLGALGFLIDMLSVQPQMAKSLFVYDADHGTLSPLMGRNPQPPVFSHSAPAPLAVEPRLIEQAQMLALSAASDAVPLDEVSRDLEHLSHEAEVADQQALVAAVSQAQEALESAQDEDDVASVRGQLSEALSDFVATASGTLAVEPRLTTVRSEPQSASSASAELADDAEMREIFLEEAREVMQTARAACAELSTTADALEQLTTVRRSFHTLKGSSRMVGLKDFGNAAWACEQLYNTHLADQQSADESLIKFTLWALDELGAWIDDIAAGRDAGRNPARIEAAATALRAPEAPNALPEVPDLAIGALPEERPVPSELPVIEPIALAFATESLEAPPREPTVAQPSGDNLALPPLELDLSQFDVAFDAPTTPAPYDQRVEPAAFSSAESFPATQSTPLDLGAVAGPEPVEAPEALELIDLDLGEAFFDTAPSVELVPPVAPLVAPELVSAPEVGAEPMEGAALAEDEQVKVVGTLRISIPLFNIFLSEADELSRRLTTEVAEWAMELHRPVGETAIALAHSLAGSSATVGFSDLSHLARMLEHALARTQALGQGSPEDARLLVEGAEEIRRLLHQFAAGFLKEPSAQLLQQLADHEVSSAARLDAMTAADEWQNSAPAIDHPAQAETVERIEVRPAEAAPAAIEAIEQHTAPPDRVMDTQAGPLDEEKSRPASVDTGFGADTGFNPLGLAEFKPLESLPVDVARAAVQHDSVEGSDDEVDDDIDAVDAVDAELFPIFEEEALELLPKLAGELRDWAGQPMEAGHASACMRTLHTLKGGARLAGAMRLGEMAHRLESRIEQLIAQEEHSAVDLEALQLRSDALSHTFEALRSRDVQAYAEAIATVEKAVSRVAEVELPQEAVPSTSSVSRASEVIAAAPMLAPAAEPSAQSLAPDSSMTTTSEIDWARFAGRAVSQHQVIDRVAASQSAVRVRAPLLDRLVNQAGEVSITRSRIEVEVGQIKSSLTDLTDNLERLRQQLRDIELQGETQMSSRLEAAKAQAQAFDPLEFDRFTRFQELTRMMAESVNDVATVQRTLQRTLETTEDELVAQARLTRDLQDDLLRTRMVEFEGLSDRLYRVVRQAAKETGKQVRLDIIGGSIEVDRGVLDRMTGAFEHLLRNCVTHGIEAPEVRRAANKDPIGTIVVSLTQEGNEVGVEFRDDGGGLSLSRIRDKGVAMGLIDANKQYTDGELANLIFEPGFSTADKVTELAGRGIGMDVVRAEVNAMGGRIETASASGQGTSFKLVLPLTTAVTQVVMMRIGTATVAVPSTLVEVVRRASADEIDHAYQSGSFSVGDRSVPFFWLGSLVQMRARSTEDVSRLRQVVIIRSAQQRIAVHVDEVLGNQEVVVKNLGPQLSRMPGLAGMTLLASGAVALIYNPVALATVYGAEAREATRAAFQAPALEVQKPTPTELTAPSAPMVLVVDDSLTVRRVTQRMLVREGYRVVLAKDGLDALERLAEEKPQVVLSDIEMPRMDGFDLVRNIRGDARLRDLPVIMITSRIAQKHRDYAAELGVDHYLGKPYSEEDLLALIGRYTATVREAAA